MFEAAEVGSALDKATYKRELPALRSELLQVQRDIAASRLGPLVIVGGVEGVGKGEVMNTLLAWMDARGVEAHAFGDPTGEEEERPPYWRFWRALPSSGKMAILLGSWYTDPIVDRAFDRVDDIAFEREMRRIRDFERMLNFECVPVQEGPQGPRETLVHLQAHPQVREAVRRVPGGLGNVPAAHQHWCGAVAYRGGPGRAVPQLHRRRHTRAGAAGGAG
jgi:hypothetical protein